MGLARSIYLVLQYLVSNARAATAAAYTHANTNTRADTDTHTLLFHKGR